MAKVHKPIDAFNKSAELYERKFKDVSAYLNSINFLIERLKTNSKILEIACGPGNLTTYFAKSEKEFEILATDGSENMVEIARKNNPSVNFKVFDVKNLSELNNKYNSLVAGFVLNYLNKNEVITLFLNAKQLLKTNGLLYLSFMEADEKESGIKTSSNGEIKLHLNYFSEKQIIKLLVDLNFEIVYSEKILSTSLPSKNDLILIARV